MRPKTLLEMAGVAAAAPRLSQAAVVMIDAQHEYLDGKLALPAIGPALNEIERLLARARALRTPIIHVVHHGKAGGAFAPGSPGAEIAAQAAPVPGEAVVAKGLPNAFASTDLAAFMLTVQLVPETESHPVQPVNPDRKSGFGVRITVVP